VSDNFYVLKRYNESDVYALFIGHVADRMRGAPAFARSWSPVAEGLRRGDLQAMQQRLQAEGYDVGKADGLIGFATRTAVGLWQARQGRPETCFPDEGIVSALR